MSKLNIFVCENFYLEFEKVLETEGYPGVFVKPFQCMCEDRTSKIGNQDLLDTHTAGDQTNIVLCSRYCEMNRMIPANGTFSVRSSNSVSTT